MATHCIRCNRPLTSPESLRKGIGPECERKAGGAAQRLRRAKRASGDNDRIVRYDGGVIWAERSKARTIKVKNGHLTLEEERHQASGIRTNVQRLVYDHSHSGFNFGYGGSGPADLALNILLMFCKRTADAQRLHQEFKRLYVAPCQADRLEIQRSEIEHFLKSRGAAVELKI